MKLHFRENGKSIISSHYSFIILRASEYLIYIEGFNAPSMMRNYWRFFLFFLDLSRFRYSLFSAFLPRFGYRSVQRRILLLCTAYTIIIFEFLIMLHFVFCMKMTGEDFRNKILFMSKDLCF